LTENVTISLEEVHKISVAALTCQGFSPEQAHAIAATVTAAERDECHSHGLFRIPFYIKAIANPTTDPAAEPQLSVTESSVIHVDAKDGFCPLALQVGLIAPHGGTQPVFGTNPMAFAWPRKNQPPLVFDQASSASARGEIQLHAREGKSLPDGWAIDQDGAPTNDPAAALQGAQLPFGAHKGSSIALMIELLAGALIGDLFSYESSERDDLNVGAPFGGEFLIAINPAQTLPDGNTEAAQLRAEVLFAKILEQEGTRLPSMRRFEARKRSMADGVKVPVDLHDEIVDYALAKAVLSLAIRAYEIAPSVK